MLASGTPVHLIDVRPRKYTQADPEMVAGATWRDPERIEEWIDEVPRDAPVIAFCAYGFDVGCATTARLRDAGVDASYMAGGHFAWKAIGGTMRPFSGPSGARSGRV